MHDIRMIRENPEAFDAGLARRGAEPMAEKVISYDEAKRAAATSLQVSQARKNELSKEFGLLRSRGLTLSTSELAELQSLKVNVPQGELEQRQAAKKLEDMLAAIPNLPADDVPEGADEKDNVEIACWGEPRSFAFDPTDHADLGPPLGLDFETAAQLSGSRFALLRGPMARLNRALGQFMLDRQTQNAGYTECAPPLLVRDHAMFGTGQLPKFAEDSFFAADMSNRDRLFWEAMPQDFESQMAKTSEGQFKPKLRSMLETADTAEQFWLIPTAEVSLTNIVREKILAEADLPMRFTALTQCFRSEAGAAGKDTRGLIRQHQFEKVELVSIVRPEDSDTEHERMTEAAEAILQALDLPYRKMLLCTGDMGFSARKTYDLEVWLPAQDTYREISSCSNCGDFQARRMNARYRPSGEKGTAFVHTLNGSGLAVGRTLVAILENYQQADGSVIVPDALKPYMPDVERLSPAG